MGDPIHFVAVLKDKFGDTVLENPDMELIVLLAREFYFAGAQAAGYNGSAHVN